MGIQPNLGQSPILGLDAEYIAKVNALRVSLADLKIRVIGSQEVPVELKRVTRDKVYLLEFQPAIVNGKGLEERVTIYHHEFCGAVLDLGTRNGAYVALRVNAFFRMVGGLNVWMQDVTGWREFTEGYGLTEFGISYGTLERELLWEELGRIFLDENEREGEYGIYFWVRPDTSLQVALPSKRHLPLRGR